MARQRDCRFFPPIQLQRSGALSPSWSSSTASSSSSSSSDGQSPRTSRRIPPTSIGSCVTCFADLVKRRGPIEVSAGQFVAQFLATAKKDMIFRQPHPWHPTLTCSGASAVPTTFELIVARELLSLSGFDRARVPASTAEIQWSSGTAELLILVSFLLVPMFRQTGPKSQLSSFAVCSCLSAHLGSGVTACLLSPCHRARVRTLTFAVRVQPGRSEDLLFFSS